MDDLSDLEQRFRAKYAADRPVLDLLEQIKPRLKKVERDRLDLARQAYSDGLSLIWRRKKEPGRQKLRQTLEELARYGGKAVLVTGPQRAGDFLNNQLLGRWAEQVILSLNVASFSLLPFGPSGAAMPGDEDHAEVVKTFRMISYLEGKRPDLLGFDSAAWAAFPRADHVRASSWPARPLGDRDKELTGKAIFGIEVKCSLWHYATRREKNAKPLSITIKESPTDKELTDLLNWSARTSVPILFFQVFFDEIYCISLRRMKQAIDRGFLYKEGDYRRERTRTRKETHFFWIDERHRCATVDYPEESKADVRILLSGRVVPHIDYAPARGTLTNPRLIRQEIDFTP